MLLDSWMLLTSDAVNTSVNRLSEDFRHKISDAVFSHAQRASLLRWPVFVS
jgi:hypothetical protein